MLRLKPRMAPRQRCIYARLALAADCDLCTFCSTLLGMTGCQHWQLKIHVKLVIFVHASRYRGNTSALHGYSTCLHLLLWFALPSNPPAVLPAELHRQGTFSAVDWSAPASVNSDLCTLSSPIVEHPPNTIVFLLAQRSTASFHSNGLKALVKSLPTLGVIGCCQLWVWPDLGE